MNLQEQIGALEAGVDQLLQAATTRAARRAEPAAADQPAAEPALQPVFQPAPPHVDAAPLAPEAPAHAFARDHADHADVESAPAVDIAPEAGEVALVGDVVAAEDIEAAADGKPIMQVGRPAQNEITITLGDKTVSLHPLQVGQLIEELANARASMQPEPPPGIPQGWRFVSTKNPVMAVQKQSNGDRVLVLRHTGHGWVPFTFSPDMIVQMYMMLTQR